MPAKYLQLASQLKNLIQQNQQKDFYENNSGAAYQLPTEAALCQMYHDGPKSALSLRGGASYPKASGQRLVCCPKPAPKRGKPDCHSSPFQHRIHLSAAAC